MNAEDRKNKLLALIKEGKPSMTGIPLRYKGEQRTENVYRIPLDYLIYNRYNGRIGSEVISYEAQNGTLNAENEKDKEIIERFLWESKADRNEKTMNDLLANGQQRYGIVTANGIIVDGNRRAMLLNRIYKNRESYRQDAKSVERCRYFLAIILPDNAEERDIQQLETSYQMGEDDKLDYNPIEKYLKCRKLKESEFTEKDIADFMNEKVSNIKDWLGILQLMDEYLDAYGYNGIYTRLEKTEGPFVDLYGYIDSYKKHGANVRNVDWEYQESDLSDLKVVCFDYIRARYEGKEFRDIAKTGKDGSIFFHKDLWQQFLSSHEVNTPQDEETVEDLRKRNPNEDLSKLLKSRDSEWAAKAKNVLKSNLKRFTNKLDDKRAENKPADLIERALSALNAVDQDQESFYNDPEIERMVKEINSLIWEMKKKLDRK